MLKINRNGDRFWFKGEAPEIVEGRMWWFGGKLHREDGPAVEWANGTKEWCIDNDNHRIGGPSIEFGDGNNNHFAIDGRGKFEKEYWRTLRARGLY